MGRYNTSVVVGIGKDSGLRVNELEVRGMTASD